MFLRLIRRLLRGRANETATEPPSVLLLFDLVHEELDKRNIPHALIGGLAMSTVGVARATGDVDLLVDGERESEVHGVMTTLGFTTLQRTENVSNYALGSQRVDFVHGRRSYSRVMLAEARSIRVGHRAFLAVRGEDLIGLKVQATSNDPTRTQDKEDIRQILLANNSLDMQRVRRYFTLFDREQELDSILESQRPSHDEP